MTEPAAPVPATIPKSQGDILSEHLAAHGISLASLARKIGAHPVTVWRWVAGKTLISPEYVEKIRAALGLALMVLFVPLQLIFQ
jgi:plasmid maintenance system antidote protein VapI